VPRCDGRLRGGPRRQLISAQGQDVLEEWLTRIEHSVKPSMVQNWRNYAKRIGHADVAFTMKQYVHTDLEADRQVANTLAELIIGGRGKRT
jgi:hypothetical protein